MQERWRSLVARVRAMDPRRLDLLLAVVVGLEMQVELLFSPASTGTLLAARVMLVVVAVALFVRRRAPLAAAAIGYGAFALAGFLGREIDEHLFLAFFVVIFLGFSLGLHGDVRRLIAGVLIGVAAVLATTQLDDYDDVISDYLFGWVIIVVLPVTAGRLLRNRSRLNRALHEKTQRLERERLAAAEQAVAAERGRIAGELHDVVAHALSAMVVQASGARRLAVRNPLRATDAFATVEETGREALTEIRRLLGVLRRDDEDLALAPQPSLAHVSTLVRRAEAAGLPVELRIEGEAAALPAGVDLTAYRVVQEALSGALECGCAERALVVLRYSPQHLELEVSDNGTGEPDGGTRRLLGIRERLAVYGGELHAERPRAGGHLVRARLPVGGLA